MKLMILFILCLFLLSGCYEYEHDPIDYEYFESSLIEINLDFEEKLLNYTIDIKQTACVRGCMFQYVLLLGEEEEKLMQCAEQCHDFYEDQR